jgi:hypothetical protein
MALCLYGQPVHWRSKRQPLLSMSSTEAELMAMNHGANTIKWLKMFLNEDLGIQTPDVRLYGDNLSALSIIRDPLATERTRHVDQTHKKVCENVHNDVMSVTGFQLPINWLTASQNNSLEDPSSKHVVHSEFYPSLKTCTASLGLVLPLSRRSVRRSV